MTLKRILVAVLAMVLVVTTLSLAVGATDSAEKTTDDGYTYVITDDGDAKITGVPDDVDLVFPDKIDGCEVTEIDVRCDETVESIVLPKNLKVIGETAFYGSKITKVKLPKSVETVGVAAFAHCKYLVEVTFSSRIIEINESAFYNCERLKSVYIPITYLSLDEIDEYAFNCSKSYQDDMYLDIDNVYFEGTEDEWYESSWSRVGGIADAEIHFESYNVEPDEDDTEEELESDNGSDTYGNSGDYSTSGNSNGNNESDNGLAVALRVVIIVAIIIIAGISVALIIVIKKNKTE